MEESPQPSAPAMEMQDTTNTNNAPPCPCVTTACLGPYPSAREPLKAGLDSDDDSDDDDSSIDSSTSSQDDHDGSEADDEFFFGDVDDFMSETESMFQKMRERFPAHHMMSGGSSSPKVASGGIGGINNSAHRRTSCPSLADTTATSTDVSAMDTSSDDCVPATIRGFHSYSTGALSRCHSSTLSLHSGSGKSAASSSKKKTRRRVSINSDVEVKPIPERSEYSPEVRSKMWTAGAELMQNAARNTIEFHAEGWNWRSVTEDEDMLRHTITRELIHPVHLQNAMELAKQQEDAANNTTNAGTTQQNPQNPAEFMARLPLERNDCSASMTPTSPPPPKINIPTIAATAAAHAAVATVHPQTGPLSPPAATA